MVSQSYELQGHSASVWQYPDSHADSRYYMIIFGAQRAWNLPQYTHTFATFIKAMPPVCSEDDTPKVEIHTVSWLAAKKKVCLLRLWPEAGANLDLSTSLEWALSVRSRISMWGPFEIKRGLYDKALAQKARLESGLMQYKVLDTGFRPHVACSCIHGVCDIDQDRGRLWTWFRYGESASRRIAVFFLPWIIDPHQNYPWISVHLGLNQYPIIHRQLPIGALRSREISEPRALQAQAS